jgi:GPI mannosyltransferase 3
MLTPSRIARSAGDRHVLFALVLAFRLLDALALRTFFQPDEFFQALEPAWELAFGTESGAWLTWVRRPAANCKIRRER